MQTIKHLKGGDPVHVFYGSEYKNSAMPDSPGIPPAGTLIAETGNVVPAEVLARSTGSQQGNEDIDAANASSPGPKSTASSHRGGDSSSAVGESGLGSVCQQGRSSADALLLLQRIFRKFLQGSSGVMGSCGGEGFGGSISPKGLLDIFEATGVCGRSICDLGGGNGLVVACAGLYGASYASALELAVNDGNFAIYDAALCQMAKDPSLQGCMQSCLFELATALKPGDIDKVACVELFDISHCLHLISLIALAAESVPRQTKTKHSFFLLGWLSRIY